MKDQVKKTVFFLIMASVMALCACDAGTGGNSPAASDNSVKDSAQDSVSVEDPVSETPSASDSAGNADSEEKPPVSVVEPVTYATYGSFWMRQHDDKTMPVGAYNSCPPQTSAYTYNYIGNKSTFKAYAEAGVNMMMGLYEYTGSDEVFQALEWCEDYNLAYLVRYAGGDNTTASTARSTLARARYCDAFAGVMQVDEPGRSSFEKIAKSAEAINSVIPEEYVDSTLMHVNLFPSYATQKQLYYRTNAGDIPGGSYTYDEYVKDYLDIINPKVLSYDNYPLSGHQNALNGTNYFSNMATIRAAALERNIPFWVFVQTCSFNRYTRIPNRADVLWQVNTALSYGAKGIQYFCGVCPADGGETFTGSMFDRDGNKTDVYDYVKTAGAQIGAVDEVLMHCKSKGLMLVGSLPYNGDSGIPDADLHESFGGLFAEDVVGSHSLIGCFDHDGKPAFYITNNSVTENEELTLNFVSDVKGYTVRAAVKESFTGTELSVALQPGEGVLIVLE